MLLFGEKYNVMENDIIQATNDNKKGAVSRLNFVIPEPCSMVISLFFVSLLYVNMVEINTLTGIVNSNKFGKIVTMIFRKFPKSRLYSVTKYKNLIVLVIHTMEVIMNKTKIKYLTREINRYFL
jgi:hypothetical protein